jgi:hypothetical protein
MNEKPISNIIYSLNSNHPSHKSGEIRINQLIPDVLISELLRLYKLDPNWCELKDVDELPSRAGSRYTVKPKYSTWLSKISPEAASWSSNWAISWWLGLGPKMFKPKAEHVRALENVEVNLTLEDFTSPYPSILVDLSPYEHLSPFMAVIVTRLPDHLVCTMFSENHMHDVTITIAQTQDYIEASIKHYNNDVTEDHSVLAKVLRVALNSCLALSHFGNHIEYLFPKEVERDKKFASKNNDHSDAARKRIKLAMRVVSFSQETKLHRERTNTNHTNTGTGPEQSEPKWRRGHWAMQPFGPQIKDVEGKWHWKRENRKRIYRAPVLTKADLFDGNLSNTEVVYR